MNEPLDRLAEPEYDRALRLHLQSQIRFASPIRRAIKTPLAGCSLLTRGLHAAASSLAVLASRLKQELVGLKSAAVELTVQSFR